MFEDAFVVRDRDALAELFDDGAVLVADGSGSEARGGEAIVRSASALWESDRTYLAEPRRVVQVRDTALVVGPGGVNVVRRGRDSAWRYAISVLSPTELTTKEETMTSEARWWFSALAEIKATAQDTGGLMTIVEMTEPPGAEAPLHVHHREDEAFYVLDGGATFHVGDATVEGRPGDYLFGPRDVPHRYTVGPDGCRMLFICTPGGFEELVREMSVPAEQMTLPPPSDQEPDWEHVAAVAKANGCELLA